MLKGMIYLILADLVVLVHFAFILFVTLGGSLVFKWRWITSLHIPSAFWGALIEFEGWVCPLTPLENRLRDVGGGLGYGQDFIEHYLMPIIYPPALSRRVQLTLGAGVVLINGLIYAWLLLRCLRRQREN
jgi:hypothetical protein